MVAAADKASPLQVKSFGKGGRGPSDHQSFAMKNIPVLFFFSGMHPDYHRPSDDADKVNYTGLSEVVDFGMQIVNGMATMPPQQYVAKYDGQTTALSGSGSRGTRVSLGVVPDYGSDEATGGVKITGTSPGSPAESAGLKEGDVIIQIAAKQIDNLYDLTDFLADAQPGDKVKIVFERNKQRMESETTLVERKG
jgi:predicted metalloprotease with PDZ domain